MTLGASERLKPWKSFQIYLLHFPSLAEFATCHNYTKKNADLRNICGKF